MIHPDSDLTFCDKCDHVIGEDDEAIEKHACGSPYYICVKCAGN